jgi:hypothetical protein
MGIIQFPTTLPAQVGIVPATKKMVSSDNLSTITAAGYLNQFNLDGNPISPTDILEVIYSYVAATNSGTYGVFTPSISNGVITLNSFVGGANVLLNNAVNTMASGSEIILAKGTATTTAGAATVNQQSGVLTTPSLTTASGSAYVITLTNSEIAASSVLLCQVQGGTNTTPGITIIATPAAGSATISLENSGVAAAALNGTVIIGFAVF